MEHMEGKPIACKQTPSARFFFFLNHKSHLCYSRRLLHNTHCCSLTWLFASSPSPLRNQPTLDYILPASSPRRSVSQHAHTLHTTAPERRALQHRANSTEQSQRIKVVKNHSSAVRSPPACRPTDMCSQSEARRAQKSCICSRICLVHAGEETSPKLTVCKHVRVPRIACAVQNLQSLLKLI